MTNLFLQKKSIKLDYHTEPKKKGKKAGRKRGAYYMADCTSVQVN